MSKQHFLTKSCFLGTVTSDNHNHQPTEIMDSSISPSTPLLYSTTTTTTTTTSSFSSSTEDPDEFSPQSSSSSSLQFNHPISKPINSTTTTHKLLTTITDSVITSLAICGSEFLITATNTNEIIIRQQPTLQHYTKFTSPTTSGAIKSLIAVGNRVFTAHQDRLIRVWRLSSSSKSENMFKLTATMPTTRDYLTKFMKQSNYVKTRRHHKKLWIEHGDSVTCLTAINGLIYSGSWDKCVKVWSVKDFKCLESIQAHDDAVSGLVVSKFSKLVFSSSADGKIKAWSRKDSDSESSFSSHGLVAVLDGQMRGNNSTTVVVPVNTLVVVEYSNHNNNNNNMLHVYGGRGDGYITGWEMVREENTTTAEVVRWRKRVVCEVKAHERAVLCMCVRGEILCTGSADKTIGIWRIKKKEGGMILPVGVISGHDGPVKCLQAADGGVSGGFGCGFLLYSGSLDKTLRVWWVPKPSNADDDDSKQKQSELSIVTSSSNTSLTMKTGQKRSLITVC